MSEKQAIEKNTQGHVNAHGSSASEEEKKSVFLNLLFTVSIPFHWFLKKIGL